MLAHPGLSQDFISLKQISKGWNKYPILYVSLPHKNELFTIK